MRKIKLFKAFCIVLTAGTICIIPANLMEASKADNISLPASTTLETGRNVNRVMLIRRMLDRKTKVTQLLLQILQKKSRKVF